MSDSINPINLLDLYNVSHPEFRGMINGRCNRNLARFINISNSLKDVLPDSEVLVNFLNSYKILKNFPQAVISLIMVHPTFHFWIEISNNVIARLLNDEKIPIEDTPHHRGILDSNNESVLSYHFLDLNRYILAMSILNESSVVLKCPVYEGKLVIPYYGINIKIYSEDSFITVAIKDTKPYTIIINDKISIDLSDSISSFKNAQSIFKETEDLIQSECVLFSKGRVLINSYDPYYKYEVILPYVFPYELKAKSPDYNELIEWGKLIKESQNILKKYWPEIEGAIGYYLYEIVPVKSPLEDVSISNTSSSFHGSIFCSDTEPYEMSETLIHEFSHNLLNDVMDNYDIFDKDSSRKEDFYSPWRPDPRHLNGILHAVYVFEKVAEYYARLLMDKNNNDIDTHYVYRYSLIVSRLKLAIITIIDNAILTNFGKKFIDSLDKKINKHIKNSNYDKKLSIDEIDKHYKDWIYNNQNNIKPRLN